MSIIKIHLYRLHSAQQQKYLLTYIPQIHPTIRSFVDFAINALDIKLCGSDDLIVENDGYMIPLCLDGKILQNINSLTIKVKTNIVKDQKKSTQHVANTWTAYKPTDKLKLHKGSVQQQQNIENSSQRIQEQEQNEESDSSTPKFSQDGLADRSKKQLIIQNLIKKKQTNKINEQISKQKKIQDKTKTKVNKTEKRHKKIEQSQKSQQSEQLKQKLMKNKRNTPELKKGGKKIQSFKKQSSSEESSSESEQKQHQPHQQKESSLEQQQSGNQSSSESSQSSQEQLPRVVRTKKAQLKQKIQQKQENHKIHKREQLIGKDGGKKIERRQQPSLLQSKFARVEKPQFTSNQQQKQEQFHHQKTKNQKPKQFPVTYANRKKLIQADDIESSDNSSEGQSQLKTIIKPNINKPVEVNVNNNKKPLIEKQQQHFVEQIKSNTQPSLSTATKMVPPSLRNKPPATTTTSQRSSPIYQKPTTPSISSFKQHQLQQWILVTKQILTTYKQTLPEQKKQIPFLKPNNLIKFKQIELDEQRFVPKESQWIEGTVQSVDEKDGKLVLVKVSQLGRDYRERLQAYEHNMVVLEVNRNYLTQQQRNIIIPTKQTNQSIQQAQPQSQQQPQLQTKPTTTNDKTSIQKFICGQMNYYFSENNYPYDLFMQMHANKHPQKYIPLRFMLNFPKIKKVLKDENKLLQYLLEDEKYNSRNFQIDPQRKLVRKKIINPSTVGEVTSQDQKQSTIEQLQQME